MSRYGLYQIYQGKTYFCSGSGSLPAMKSKARKHLNTLGHPVEFKIERDGKPWLTGKSIKPRCGEVRIEWREDYENN